MTNYAYSVVEEWCDDKKIYRLSDDERKWVEVGEIKKDSNGCAVASLNGRIYITGGYRSLILRDK